jgi:hypothetical protein
MLKFSLKGKDGEPLDKTQRVWFKLWRCCSMATFSVVIFWIGMRTAEWFLGPWTYAPYFGTYLVFMLLTSLPSRVMDVITEEPEEEFSDSQEDRV